MRADIHDGQEHKRSIHGRIQKRKTNHLHPSLSAQHFFIRAEMGKNAGRNTLQVDEDYKQAAALAALAAPYRETIGNQVGRRSEQSGPV